MYKLHKMKTEMKKLKIVTWYLLTLALPTAKTSVN